MIQHLPAVLIIVGTLAIWAFYAMFAVATRASRTRVWSISHGKAASRPSLATNGTLSATTSKP